MSSKQLFFPHTFNKRIPGLCWFFIGSTRCCGTRKRREKVMKIQLTFLLYVRYNISHAVKRRSFMKTAAIFAVVDGRLCRHDCTGGVQAWFVPINPRSVSAPRSTAFGSVWPPRTAARSWPAVVQRAASVSPIEPVETEQSKPIGAAGVFPRPCVAWRKP